MDAGEHHVLLRKNGYVSREARLTVAGDEVKRLDLALDPKLDSQQRFNPRPPNRSDRRHPLAPPSSKRPTPR